MAISPIHVSALEETRQNHRHQHTLLDLVKSGSYEKVRDYLQAARTPAVIQDKLGDTPLHIAISHSISRIAMLLLLRMPQYANIANYSGQLPIHCAVLANDLDLFKCLLLKTENLLARTDAGDTILHLICRVTTVDADTLQVYLDAIGDTDINARNDMGETAVHAAAQKANYLAVIKLGQLGFDFNSKNDNGDTPLHFVMPYGDELLVKTFLRFGANVNVKNNQGDTILHALLQSTVEMNELKAIFVLLLQSGANVNLKNNEGLTAIDVAEDNFEPALYDKFHIFYEQQCRLLGDGSIKLV